jgi:hypothetical protein
MQCLEREDPPDLASAQNNSLWIGEANVIYLRQSSMSGATVEDKWPRDNLAARAPRTVIYGIYAAAGKENRPVLNHFGIGDKKCGASLVGACTKIGTFDMPSMASKRAGRLISARHQALSHR